MLSAIKYSMSYNGACPGKSISLGVNGGDGPTRLLRFGLSLHPRKAIHDIRDKKQHTAFVDSFDQTGGPS